MMRSILYICIVVSIFQGSQALKCYVCLGSPDSDCAQNQTSSMGTQVCYKPKPHIRYESESPEEDNGIPDVQRVKRHLGMRSKPNPPPHSFDVHCLYLTTKQNKYGSELVIRECAYVYHNQDICEFYKKSRKNINQCTSCDDDLCNL